MALSVGDKLGPYEIVAPNGKGGMGEVWKARDTVGPGPTFDKPPQLFQARIEGGDRSFRTHYVPTRDGQRFLINTLEGDPVPAPITVVLNRTTGLKK